MSVQWFALRVAPMRELAVQKALHQREYPAIVPCELKWRKQNSWSGQRVKREYPLFSRYVFAAFADLPREYAELRKDKNLRDFLQGVVCQSRTWSPRPLSKHDVALIMQLAGNQAVMTTVDIHRALKPGGMAEITMGPLAGHTVKIDKVTASKARVLLKLLNSMRVVDIPVGALEAA